ncbi:MAG: FecR domain-containing protein [Tannerella sp.]|jgi:ferric-dicitrate binding protein FerR (iron transport regulator)|nr:FecR domain-containing protein [Tannerella sp.]
MKRKQTDINEVMISYLAGYATTDEKRELLQWLKTSDENVAEYAALRRLWQSSDMNNNAENEADNAALGKLHSRILEDSLLRRQHSPTRYVWYSAAAVILVLVCATYWMTTHPVRTTETRTCIVNTFVTARGSKGKFVLPDGTVVWLNTESKLVCPDVFDGDTRSVRLEGEAYFEVARDDSKSFIVQTADMDVRALGTKFDVVSYGDDPTPSVVLLEGSVEVDLTARGDGIKMHPGQRLEYSKTGNDYGLQNVNASLYASWINSRLEFDKTRLADIIVSMERWYNVSIKCPADFARTQRLSFTIRNENASEIMEALSMIIPIHYRLTDKEIVIIPQQY